MREEFSNSVLDSAYLKYEIKLRLPLLTNMLSHLFSRPHSQESN